MRNLKKKVIQMNLFTKENSKLTNLENILMVTMGERLVGIVREFGMDIYTLLYLKWIINKDLLYSTQNSAQIMWQPGWEGSLGENGYMYMYG